MTYGRLRITGFVKQHKGHTYVKCVCECKTEIVTTLSRLDSGKTKSCGCLQRELLAARRTTHGLSDTFEHIAWMSMRTRCNNPNYIRYARYGGRGIKVCEEWQNSFENFLRDMGRCPPDKTSLDRENNDGNYCKENCRWATAQEQANNRCNT